MYRGSGTQATLGAPAAWVPIGGGADSVLTVPYSATPLPQTLDIQPQPVPLVRPPEHSLCAVSRMPVDRSDSPVHAELHSEGLGMHAVPYPC